jgi:hypothetical protein
MKDEVPLLGIRQFIVSRAEFIGRFSTGEFPG